MVDSNRALFITEELNSMGFTLEQAKRARVWILYGDWRMKGADPTLEISDFFPDDEQYLATVQRMNAQRLPSQSTIAVRTNGDFADYMRRYIANDGFMH